MGLIYKTGRLYGGGGGGADYVELTQIQYDALTPAQKMDGTIYLITDGGGAADGSATYYGTVAPTPSLGGNGDMYVLYNDSGENPSITTMYIKIEDVWTPTPTGGSGGGGSISYRRFIPTEGTSTTSTITITENEV